MPTGIGKVFLWTKVKKIFVDKKSGRKWGKVGKSLYL